MSKSKVYLPKSSFFVIGTLAVIVIALALGVVNVSNKGKNFNPFSQAKYVSGEECSHLSDDFDGSSLDYSRWDKQSWHKDRLKFNGRVLGMELNPERSSDAGTSSFFIETLADISGDFTVEVDLKNLLVENAAAGQYGESFIEAGGGKSRDNSMYISKYYSDGAYSLRVSGFGSRYFGSTPLSGDINTRVKIVRVGDTFKVYYKTDRDYQLIASDSKNFKVEDKKIELRLGLGRTYPSDISVSGNFDNLQVKCDQKWHDGLDTNR